jgi:putative endonuclease
MANQGDTGSWGERRAAAHLARLPGYSVVAVNWRNPADRREELDLVCRDRDVLVFVEVKTRGGDLVPGFWSVDRRKRRALRRAITSYLRLLRYKPRTFRLDVVEIEAGPGGPELRHFENVPLFDKHESF